MKNLKDVLNESLVNEGVRRDDAEKAIYDLLKDKCKVNKVRMSDDKLHDLSREITNWYDEEQERSNHNNVKSFIKYVEKDLPEMADAATDEEHREAVLKILGFYDDYND